jgi:hypothetical protein
MRKYPGGEIEQLKREMEEAEPWVYFQPDYTG